MVIQQLTLADAPALLQLSRKTFFDAFLQQNNPDDIEAYASQAFTIDKLSRELSNPDSEFYFAVINNQPAAYLKLNFRNAQTELQDTNALEIERIYVLQQHQGLKIGKQLLDFTFQKAADNGLSYIWLGVWEHNIKAQKFYQSHGFEVFSSHQFILGKDEQTDLLMKKLL